MYSKSFAVVLSLFLLAPTIGKAGLLTLENNGDDAVAYRVTHTLRQPNNPWSSLSGYPPIAEGVSRTTYLSEETHILQPGQSVRLHFSTLSIFNSYGSEASLNGDPENRSVVFSVSWLGSGGNTRHVDLPSLSLQQVVLSDYAEEDQRNGHVLPAEQSSSLIDLIVKRF